jgi:hypothetical protein
MEVSGHFHTPAALPPRESRPSPGTQPIGGFESPRSVVDAETCKREKKITPSGNPNLVEEIILFHTTDMLLFCTVHNTGCSKSHSTHGLLGICVSWTSHFKEIVASTIPGLKNPRLLFMGAPQGYCVFRSSTHTPLELQANIQRTVDRISTGTLQYVFANMIRRVHLCE